MDPGNYEAHLEKILDEALEIAKFTSKDEYIMKKFEQEYQKILGKYYSLQPECKEDCYWYEEWQDMNAIVPACKKKKDKLCINPEDCLGCEFYRNKYEITNADVFEGTFGFELKYLSYDEILEWIDEPYKKP